MLVKQGWRWGWMLCGGMVWLAGCGQSKAPDGATAQQAGSTETNSADEAAELPTASITRPDGEDDDDDAEDVAVVEPEEGSPEWHVREIVRLRLMPFPTLKNPAENAATDTEAEEATEESTAKELEHQAAVRRERNLEVINLAKQTIALTHQKPEKEMVFNIAVHHLLDARLQLAFGGDQEDVEALYEIAEVLQRTRPNTEVAAAAGLTIVNFAHANAVRYAQTEPKWIQEFARQAQLFANSVAASQAAFVAEEGSAADKHRSTQLQNDASRAAQILLAAGQSCEAAGFVDEGKACYLLLKSKLPETAPAQQADGIVRRMNLRGQPLQLAGPTLDGNFLSIEDLKGKTVLVIFWSSQAKPFVDQLPALMEFLKKAPKQVTVVGVSLDTDELDLADFVEARGLTWPQIFYSEPEKRGWNSPVASYYGISSLPTFWIVDSTGVVAETDVTPSNVKTKLVQVFKQSQQANKSSGNQEIRQAGNVSNEK